MMRSAYALALLALVLVACAGPTEEGMTPDVVAPQEDAVVDSFDQAFEEPVQDDGLSGLETLEEDLQIP